MLLRAIQVLRDLWLLLGITLFCLAGSELAARVGIFLRDTWENGGKPQLIDPSLEADVYQNQDWAEEYWREENQTLQTSYARWHSYVYWRRAPYQGKYINIDENGIRRTWNPPPSPLQLKIFMFGGSTLWGTGARDDFTIPSLVSKRLAAKNIDAWVTNFGEGGYVSTQEVIALMLELQKGNIPDVVVFYDGANDAFSAFQQGVAGIPQNEYNRASEFNQINWRSGFVEKLALYRVAGKLAEVLARNRATERADSQLANAVIDVYWSNVQIVESLAQKFGFAVVFYWQPDIYSKKTLSAWEKRQLDRYHEARFFQQVNQISKQGLSTHAGDDFHDLSDTFVDVPTTVFIDAFHTSEAGNDKIADLIVQTMPLAAPKNKVK